MTVPERAPGPGEVVDLRSGAGRAVLWGLATEDLNVNLVAWPTGAGVDEHVNDGRDVLVVVVDGALRVTIDGGERHVPAGSAVVIPRGARREIRSEDDATRYLTVHRRRPPLDVDRT